MKITYQLVLLTAVGFSALSGCATTDNGSPALQNERTAAIIETGAQLGAYYAILKEPDSRPYFEAAQVVINEMLNEGVYDPAALQKGLNELESGALQSPEAQMALISSVRLYKVYFGQQIIDGAQPSAMRPLLQGLYNGIGFGLNAKLTQQRYGLARP